MSFVSGSSPRRASARAGLLALVALGVIVAGSVRAADDGDGRDLATLMRHFAASRGVEASFREEKTLPLLQQRGFVIWKLSPHLISIVKSHLYVDIMCARPGGHCINLPCDQYLPLMRPLQRVRMYGMEFWAPALAYLERVYGKDWRSPRHQWKPGPV